MTRKLFIKINLTHRIEQIHLTVSNKVPFLMSKLYHFFLSLLFSC